MEIDVKMLYNSVDLKVTRITPHYVRSENLMMTYPTRQSSSLSNNYFEISKEQALKLAHTIIEYYEQKKSF